MAQSIFNLTAKMQENFIKFADLLLDTTNRLFPYKHSVASVAELRAISKPLNGEIRTVASSDSGYKTYKFLRLPEDNMSVNGYYSANDGTGIWGEADRHHIRFIPLPATSVVPAGKWFMYSSVRTITTNYGAMGWGSSYLCRYEPGGVPTEYSLNGADYPTPADQMDFKFYPIERTTFGKVKGAFINPIFVNRLGVETSNSNILMYDNGSMRMKKSLAIRSIDTSTNLATLRLEATNGASNLLLDRTTTGSRIYSPTLPIEVRSPRLRIRNLNGALAKKGSYLRATNTLGDTEWVHPLDAGTSTVSSTKGVPVDILGYRRQNSYFDVHYCSGVSHLNVGLLHSKMAYGMWSANINVYFYNFPNLIDIRATGYMYTNPYLGATVVKASEVATDDPSENAAPKIKGLDVYMSLNDDSTDWSPVIKLPIITQSSYHDSFGTITMRGNASPGELNPADSKKLTLCVNQNLNLKDFVSPRPLLYGNRQALVTQTYYNTDSTNTSSDPYHLLIGGSTYCVFAKDEKSEWVWEINDGIFHFDTIGFCSALSGMSRTNNFDMLDTKIKELKISVSDDGANWTLATTVTNAVVYADIPVNADGKFIKFETTGSTNRNIYARHITLTGDFV